MPAALKRRAFSRNIKRLRPRDGGRTMTETDSVAAANLYPLFVLVGSLHNSGANLRLGWHDGMHSYCTFTALTLHSYCCIVYFSLCNLGLCSSLMS